MYLPCAELKARYRDSDNDQATTWTRWQDPSWTAATQLETSPGFLSVDRRQVLGYDHPDFHRRKNAGELLCKTPYRNLSVVGQIEVGEYSYRHYVLPNPRYVDYSITGRIGIPTTAVLTEADLMDYIPDLDNSLVQNAAVKIQSESHDTLTFLAEIVKTKEMFTKIVMRIIRMDIPKNVTSVGNDWLEARYGWRTLMMDLGDLSEAVKNLSKGKVLRRSKTSRSKITTYSPSLKDYLKVASVVDLHEETIDEVTIEQVGSVTADVSVPAFSFNPFVTAWEVIPYSFVIDWVIGVGKAISALSFVALNHQYAASIGYQVTLKRSYEQQSVAWYSASGHLHTKWSQTAILKYRYPVRVPKLPQIRVKLSVAKIYDLMAMLLQLKHGGR